MKMTKKNRKDQEVHLLPTWPKETLFSNKVNLKKLWNLTVWYDVAFIVLYINQKKSNDFMRLNIAAQYVL